MRFLPALLRQVSFDATTTTDSALAAIKHLAAVEAGQAVLSDGPTSHVGKHWIALVFRDDGTLDAGAYTLCMLDALRLAIRRRDVFVPDALLGRPKAATAGQDIVETQWRQRETCPRS